MNLRREPTYLSNDVWRACWLIAQSRGTVTDEQGLSRITTADEMADTLLRELFQERYPQLLELQKTVDKIYKEAIKTLGKVT